MRAPIRSYLFTVAIAVLAAAWLFLQRQSASELRTELATLQEQNGEIAKLRTSNAKLARQQISATELEALREDHTAVSRLRSEIDQLKRRTEEFSRNSNTPAQPVVAPKAPTPSITEEMVPASLWRNAGRASAPATMETVLWAGANGDVKALAVSLAFDQPALMKANELWGRLNETTRNQFGTPEQLIASLTAKDVPQGGAKIVLFPHEYPDGEKLVVQMLDASQKNSFAVFTMRQVGMDWKVVVPASAVEKYAASLNEPAPVTAAR